MEPPNNPEEAAGFPKSVEDFEKRLAVVEAPNKDPGVPKRLFFSVAAGGSCFGGSCGFEISSVLEGSDVSWGFGASGDFVCSYGLKGCPNGG